MSRSDHRRTADVAAICPCELFELSKEDVYAVTQKYPVLQVSGMCFVNIFTFVYVKQTQEARLGSLRRLCMHFGLIKEAVYALPAH